MQFEKLASEAEYRQALAEIMDLVAMEPDRGTEDGDRLDALAVAVDSYEAVDEEAVLEDAAGR